VRIPGDGPDFYADSLNNPVNLVDLMGTSFLCPFFSPGCPSDLPPHPPSPPAPGLPWLPTYDSPPPTTGLLPLYPASSTLRLLECVLENHVERSEHESLLPWRQALDLFHETAASGCSLQ